MNTSTILINGFEVPEPMRVKPDLDASFYLICISYEDCISAEVWSNHETDYKWLNEGRCHATRESAVAHAKALLGINPSLAK